MNLTSPNLHLLEESFRWYGPPDPVPTARLLGELAEGLRAGGHTVEIVSQSHTYQGRPAGGGRLKRELQASWTILRKGWTARDGRPEFEPPPLGTLEKRALGLAQAADKPGEERAEIRGRAWRHAPPGPRSKSG